MSIEPGYILIGVTLVQLVQLIGRWTGKIDVSAIHVREDLIRVERDVKDEIKKIRAHQYEFIQWEQVASGKIGILENDVSWIKNICNKRHPDE